MTEIKRKLATIETIKEIRPIDGADAIEIAIVRGWQVVVQKGDFVKNDLCVYCEIDSLVPDVPVFEFLRPHKFRIRTIRLRKQLSQGIIFPLSIMHSFGDAVSAMNEPEYNTVFINEHNIGVPVISGEDVTDFIGVKKYEAPIPACLSGDVNGGFPGHSIKTDEERIQNFSSDYEEFRKLLWMETEKLDGASTTYAIKDNGPFTTSSRNWDLKESAGNSLWRVARAQKIEEKMRAYMKTNDIKSLTIQGELIGEGIQKNLYKIKGQCFRIFRIFNPDTYKFYGPNTTITVCKDLGLKMVPVRNKSFSLPEKMEDLLLHVDANLNYQIQKEKEVYLYA